MTRIELKNDSTFRYVYAFDLFYYDLVGTYHFRNDTIFLKFPPTSNDTVIVIDTNYYELATDPPTQITLIDTLQNVYSVLDYHPFPEKLLYQKNKLIELFPGIDVTRKTRKYLNVYKRVSFDQFNNSGATFLRISN